MPPTSVRNCSKSLSFQAAKGESASHVRSLAQDVITVDYPPGAVDPVHRHDAHAFVYVLQGSIVMQVRGGEEVTLLPGQTFYEGPNDVHTIGRNASSTKPAKFLVFLLKNSGEPVAIPAN